MPIFLLIVAGTLPVLVTTGFWFLDNKTSFKNLNNILKQIIIGVVYGGLAILATEVLSSDVGKGTLLNVRDAAPLTCGLAFGAPAGIIAGVLGGGERALSVLWGGGTYTVIACSVATFLAGVFGSLCRKFMFGNKNPSWFFAFLLGLMTEVLHMLLIFLTNMTDAQAAFSFVQKVTLPMVTANTISVTLSAIILTLLEKRSPIIARGKRTIAQIIEAMLLACVGFAFAATSVFTYFLQDNIVKSDTQRTLSMVAHDVNEDIREGADLKLLESARSVADELQNPNFKPLLDMFDNLFEGIGTELLFMILQAYADEINVVDTNGIIVNSTVEDNIGFDMSAGEQSAAFLCLLGDTEEFVQSYGPIARDSNKSMKYAGKKLPPCSVLPDGGFVQVGFNTETYFKSLEERVKIAAENRHLGRSGYVIILDEQGNVVSAPEGHGDDTLNLKDSSFANAPFETFMTEVAGEMSYCQYSYTEGYHIVAVYPESDAALTRNISVYVLIFLEIISFTILFLFLDLMIKRRIVSNIDKVNSSLAEITAGNLDTIVDVRDGVEFSTLSDDINATVATLKQYIEAEAKRLDKELEFAQRIQLSALPSVFPPYPDHKEFDIFASMDAAKEVGGDFYDFYFAGPDKFVFMIADVSGKGIPAAMFMMTAKTHLRNMTESGMDIAEVFTKVNQRLCESNAADMFVTAWMGALDLRTGLLSFVNAGHNPPLVKKKDGKFEYLRSKVNFILAGMDMTRYKRQEIQLEEGDEIFLYTDGVTEATNPEEQLFGEDRLKECLDGAKTTDPTEICHAVRAAVDKFADSAPQFDDITMVCFRLNSLFK